MKQKIFTLIMMLALVIVAGSAFAQTPGDKFSPFVDTDHTYSLTYTLPAAGTVTLNITSADDASLTNITIGSILPTGVTNGGSFSQNAGDYTLSIPIEFEPGAVVGDVYNISFVTSVTATTCSNNIDVDITITANPTYTIAISTASGGCQALNVAPANNVDASVGSENTVTYTVTPGTAPDGVESYTYSVGVASTDFIVNCASCANPDLGTYTATFESVEGTGGTVVGTVGGTFTMDAAHGGQTYSMTAGTLTATATYSAMPTIGNVTNGGFY